MEEVPTESNTGDGGFVDRYFEMYPDAPYLNEEAETNYFSTYMYKEAVEQAGTLEQPEVIEALESGISLGTERAPRSASGRDDRARPGDAPRRPPHVGHEGGRGTQHRVRENEKIPEQFLSNTVGCDLTQQDEQTQYTPVDYFEEAE